MSLRPFHTAAFLVLLLAQPGVARRQGPAAATASGPVRGKADGTTLAFLGIPYAAPPTGERRWRPPQPPQPWTGPRDATRFGPSCWQAVAPEGFGPWSREYVVQGGIGEDCLSLNIWTPARARKAPVLFWIHGGGFNSGSGALPIYNGAALARRGIVVITINYRVNIFGFLAHPELTAAANGAPPANVGLQDIIAALRWTRRNVARFGGDPDRVTIAGQSAGAAAVHDLIASPLARGLFVRAIAQSGLPVGRTMADLATAEREGLAFAKQKGAGSLAALRASSGETLQASRGANAIRFTPVVDGVVLPQTPEAAIRDGRSADVAVLAGFNADEASSSPTYADDDPEPQRARWRSNLASWAGLRAKNGRAATYAYYFSHVTPGPEATRWRAFHSSEIPYVFSTLDAAPERGYTAADRALSDTMSRFWVNFIRTGDPNGLGLPKWPAYEAHDPEIMEFKDAAAIWQPTSR